MKKIVKTKVKWIPFDLGGREKLPTGPRYSTVIHFEDDTNWPDAAWSIVIDFDNTSSEPLETIASMWFLAYEDPEVPNHFLEPGNRFELVEGRKIIAKGEIIS